MIPTKLIPCFYCSEKIIPEETGGGWLFECDCGAIWESRGMSIPKIVIINRPVIREELDFDDE